MAKKLLIVLAVLFMTGTAFAAGVPAPASENIVIEKGVGSLLETPTTVVIPVRYGLTGANEPSLTSGDVVIWDTTSADGVTISAAINNVDQRYAGVLVTNILTSDIGGTFDRNSRNWGYMAIKGYCLALVDTSKSDTGERLNVNGDTLPSSFDTAGATEVSGDIGILLKDDASDGLMPVILH